MKRYRSAAITLTLALIASTKVVEAETVILTVDGAGSPIADATVFIDFGGKGQQSVVMGNTDSSGRFKCTLDERVFSYRATGYDESGRVGHLQMKKTTTWNAVFQLKLAKLIAQAPPQPS